MIYFLCYILLLLFLFNTNQCRIYGSTINGGDLKDIILLPSKDYFVLLYTGIYIYNSNLTLKKKIYKFSDKEISCIYYYNCYKISEFKINEKYFISVFTQGSILYIYEVNNQIFYNNITLNFKIENNTYNDFYYYYYYYDNNYYRYSNCKDFSYDLIPYKFDDPKIEYIIYFITKKDLNFGPLYQINFFLFDINLSEESQKIEKDAYIYKEERSYGALLRSLNPEIQISFDFDPKSGDNYKQNKYSLIVNYYISCQYITLENDKKGLICFYDIQSCYNNNNYYNCNKRITASIFDIEDYFNKILDADVNYYSTYTAYIYSILSNNKSNIFACNIYNYYYYYYQLYCFIYNINTNRLSNAKYIDKCDELYLYSFKTFNEDIILCQSNSDYIDNSYYLYQYKIFSLDVNYTQLETKIEKIFNKECSNSITYFYLACFTPNDYHLIDDCQIKSENIINSELTEKYTNLIFSSENISIDTTLPSQHSYSSNIMDSKLNFTYILSSDSASYSDIFIPTDFSKKINVSNYTNISNITKTSIYTDYISDFINASDYGNISTDILVNNYPNISNFTNIIKYIITSNEIIESNNIDSTNYYNSLNHTNISNISDYFLISDYIFEFNSTNSSNYNNSINNYRNTSDFTNEINDTYKSNNNITFNYSNYSNIYNYANTSNYINESEYINRFYDTETSNNSNSFNYNNIYNYTNLIDIINSTISIGKELLENKINIDKEDIIDNIPQIINYIEIGENYEIKGEDYTIIIRPINATHSANSTYINFKECEKLLRDVLNISSSRIITFLQMEITNKDKSLVNQVEYQVYDDKKTLLNLSICKDIDIEITYAMKDNSLDMNSISEFNDKGIDVFNINDSFFNDICHPYSESNNDIVLADRIRDIYQNYSLCDDGCSYIGLDLINKTISCDCKVKYEYK